MSVKRVTFEKGLLRIEILFIFEKNQKGWQDNKNWKPRDTQWKVVWDNLCEFILFNIKMT